jgi:hypothetical protein
VEDALTNVHLGYSGYYDVSSIVDVSLDVRGQLGMLRVLAPGYGALWAAGNLTLYGSPNKERWVALAGVDASFTTVAALVGARARISPHVEIGGAVAVPLVSAIPLDGEIPLWPNVDLRFRL